MTENRKSHSDYRARKCTGGRRSDDRWGDRRYSESLSSGVDWRTLDQSDQRQVVDNQRLAYLSEQVVNWCPALGTALANEEVIDGKSERGGHPVVRKPLKQWMFRITSFADRLANDLDTLDWPHSTKVQQREWIGRSEGAAIRFEVDGHADQTLEVFTTRPDTLFGATFLVVAPEHPSCSGPTIPK